ncbi:hypothetical protein L227DRAFT_616173 [Lentinus tigrinus ALCF2SS1-6]|uniref:Uncharacterized protein n=1 Tax=Lentinus tigrinus ALCF2SS1-6 TaxID=1328759 RepID=A0A5C2RS20_9APHY|nr:hypothetical protein L227DRAFT_616173 [Lentinus tigrinus ALCF2SS1-6]
MKEPTLTSQMGGYFKVINGTQPLRLNILDFDTTKKSTCVFPVASTGWNGHGVKHTPEQLEDHGLKSQGFSVLENIGVYIDYFTHSRFTNQKCWGENVKDLNELFRRICDMALLKKAGNCRSDELNSNNVGKEPMNIAMGNVEDLLTEMKKHPTIQHAASFMD